MDDGWHQAEKQVPWHALDKLPHEVISINITEEAVEFRG